MKNNIEINQDLIYEAIGEIINRIEKCGASPQLTHAVSLASDLHSAIGNNYNPANNFSLERVKQALNGDK